ncbi:hypothetical protein BHAOGJBA_5165 [Methylobacterium hispanicum]|uniref:Uncharacterized protein n=1 Tax=Methylobacterium hispanicum TaxID=270350 RepID=A0AAV4ZTU2_9HYPH|nr:hypothetical protein [Methylobacterium hispanicum]GJD91617.1 hypothetical protein BHAOGJBA_5165 [Methylobacterium hispanicum]
MPAPTQEQFDAAPLYRAILPAPGEVERDWSLHEIVVGGLALVRTDTDVGGFEVRLEGVPIAVGAPHEEEGWKGYRIQYLSSDTETMMHADDRDEALRRLGRLVERAVFSQDEILFMRLRGQGVDLDRILEDGEDDLDLALGEPRYGEPQRYVRDGRRVWREGADAPNLWFEVRNDLMRCGEDGEVLCPAASPILAQIDLLRNDPEAVRHLDDVRAIRAAVGEAARIPVVETRFALHFFDLRSNGIPDSVVTQGALEAYHQPAPACFGEEADAGDEAGVPEVVDPSVVPHGRTADRYIGEIMREAAGLHVHFQEIRSGGLYRDPIVRGTMREQMTPYLGGFPMEHVMRSVAPRDPEGYAAFYEFWSAGEVVMEVPVQEHPSQPGYRTQPGHVFRRDGYDALVFADDMALYAYAFPSPPDVAARPDEQETYAPRM